VRRTLLLALLLLATAAASAHAAVVLQPVGTFASPTYLTAPSGDAERRFVVERNGTIRVARDGGTATTPFLDVSARVDLGDEGGLLSMAFAPDYAVSGRFYVFLTTGPAGNFDVEVWEYRVSANPDVADAATARRVFVVAHDDATNHVGGQLAFGPDGYLYAGIGDGGLQGDPMNRAQDTTVLLGKIVRIDPRNVSAVPEIWALGLRNPWRFSFDRLTGALLVGDVGNNTWEEIDYVPTGAAPGVNFGWSNYEGLELMKAPLTGTVLPIHQYGHVGGANSITGGYVVRDAAVPELAGRYVYADYGAGWIRSLTPALPAATDDREEVPVSAPLGSPVSFGEDGLCRVYVLAQGGQVYRITSSAPGPSTGCPASQVPPTTPPTDPGPPPGPTLTGGVRGTALQRLGAVLRSGFAARCRASADATCAVTAALNAATGRALGLRSKRDRRTTPVTFARGTARVTAGGETALRVRLSAVAKRILGQRTRPFRAAVRLRAEVVAAGERTTATTTIVLQRRV
jgi:hypothetical protein